MSCFQATFFSGPHSVGRPPRAWPCPSGPRNSGQSSARAAADSNNVTTRANGKRIGGGPRSGGGVGSGSAAEQFDELPQLLRVQVGNGPEGAPVVGPARQVVALALQVRGRPVAPRVAPDE